ncbi:hypothetical protein ADL01_20465 [Streptomyces sp. NRRL WC-3618]|uniref:hypothetical protein n=1 Tax=Streptomyces sp. NRRL WC-3618 TaxID=1519490 RepID=UPI0006AF1FC8|nr:hypothetical protein [Streptomyces sp. NRRL WC-3618]KOV70535.1 hypothetical protein ADL01_20465 [Streptomyces sp. NRRL WC-3618]
MYANYRSAVRRDAPGRSAGVRRSACTLAALAAGTALVLPQVLYVIQQSTYNSTWAETFTRDDPLARVSGTGGFVELLFTGSHPALTWIPFVFAGMAVARLDLASTAVRVRLAVSSRSARCP